MGSYMFTGLRQIGFVQRSTEARKTSLKVCKCNLSELISVYEMEIIYIYKLDHNLKTYLKTSETKISRPHIKMW